jgi:hypothetical protein
MVLQPSDERRRSGSHYTPRSLTEPNVRTTLRPILDRLAPQADDREASPPHPVTPSPPHAPTPQQILALKICDPAMGSGAFLVEACRQLCFDTFPFPEDFEANESLEAAGREYYEFRADLMVNNDEGLTKTYNRFHAPDERAPDILKLRELHAAMDHAVLEAYGWHDLAGTATCEFLLDYEEDEDDDPTARKSKRKKTWRYRWPDDFRDEVLARLLELNKVRAEEERITGLAAKGGKGSRKAAGPQSAGK